LQLVNDNAIELRFFMRIVRMRRFVGPKKKYLK